MDLVSNKLSIFSLCYTPADIRDAFSLFIKSPKGEISLGQCGDVMRALGLNPTNAEIFKVVGTSNPDGKFEKKNE